MSPSREENKRMELASKDKDLPALGDRWLAYVFGHPLRVRIMATLGLRSMSLQELAEALGVPLPRVAYHYGVLRSDGGNLVVDDEVGRP